MTFAPPLQPARVLLDPLAVVRVNIQLKALQAEFRPALAKRGDSIGR